MSVIAAGGAAPAPKPYRPLYWVSCVVSMDLVHASTAGLDRTPDGIDETALDYTLTIYTNMDVDAECSAGIGTLQSGTNAKYYPAAVKGAQNGACIATADYPSPNGTEVGGWKFEIALDAGPQATYIDTDNPAGLNGFVYKFTGANCNSDALKDDGTWVQVTLPDVF